MRYCKQVVSAFGLAVAALSLACGGGGGGSPTSIGPPPPPAPPPPTATATADYRVTFDASWSTTSHPQDPPPNPHFSPLIGATHDDSLRIWQVDDEASDGIKAMAEEGKTSPLDSEINQAISRGDAEVLILGPPVPSSPDTVRVDFTASLDYPFVSLVSMVAPSPDWFVGVSALSLMENGDWVRRIDVELFAYDAGTDSGTRFTSPNRPVNPREPIERIAGRPFVANGDLRPLGTFTFRRID